MIDDPRIQAITARLPICVLSDGAAAIHMLIDTVQVEIAPARFGVIPAGRIYGSAGYDTAPKRVDLRIGGTQSIVRIT